MMKMKKKMMMMEREEEDEGEEGEEEEGGGEWPLKLSHSGWCAHPIAHSQSSDTGVYLPVDRAQRGDWAAWADF